MTDHNDSTEPDADTWREALGHLRAWPTEMWPEHLALADAYMESYAQAYDAILPPLGDALRHTWALIRPRPTCDCPTDPHHRWNCPMTPLWADTIRELDTNPWTVMDTGGRWHLERGLQAVQSLKDALEELTAPREDHP
jgi:hypothetical protein